MTLSDGSGISFTVREYFTPTGRSELAVLLHLVIPITTVDVGLWVVAIARIMKWMEQWM
jgi:hypothetical protein